MTSERAASFHHKQKHDMGIRTGLGEACCPQDRRVRDKRSQPLPAGQPAGHPNRAASGTLLGVRGGEEGGGVPFGTNPPAIS